MYRLVNIHVENKWALFAGHVMGWTVVSLRCVARLGVKFPLTVINIDERIGSRINVAWLIIVIYRTEWELYDGGEIIDFES
jgi:hypothetical protein